VTFGREARADNHIYGKRTIIRKNLQAKFKYIRIEHTRQKKQNRKKKYFTVTSDY